MNPSGGKITAVIHTQNYDELTHRSLPFKKKIIKVITYLLVKTKGKENQSFSM